MLELLPDELLLSIFCYLDKFALLCAFTNLNRRFQQIVEPYLYDIDLTQTNRPSSHQFQMFCKFVLPLNGYNIRSLKLGEYQQLLRLRQLIDSDASESISRTSSKNVPLHKTFTSFLKKIIHSYKSSPQQSNNSPMSQFFSNLQSLSLEIDIDEVCHESYPEDELNQLLIETLSIPSLSKLSICDRSPSLFLRGDLLVLAQRKSQVLAKSLLKTIASYASRNLTNITLLSAISYDNSGFIHISPIPNVTRLSINIQYIDTLGLVFKIMPNLEELNIAVEYFIDLKQWKDTKIPRTLEKLHLEFGSYHYGESSKELEETKHFLNVFKSQIRSLTLITINANQEFSNFNKFQSLVKDFSRLEKFQYYVSTIYYPDSLFANVQQLPNSFYLIFTLPQPQQIDTVSERVKLFSSLGSGSTRFCHVHTLSVVGEYLDVPLTFRLPDNLRLECLKKILIEYSTVDLSADVCLFLSKIINISPNLSALSIKTRQHSENIIKHLHDIIRPIQAKQITCLNLQLDWYNRFYRFHETLFLELSIMLPNLKTLIIDVCYRYSNFCFEELLRDLRRYFPKLTCLKLRVGLCGDRNSRNELQEYKNDLYNMCQEQTDNSLYYIGESTVFATYYLNIWL